MPVYMQPPPQLPDRKEFSATRELNNDHPGGIYMRIAGMREWSGYTYEVYGESGAFNGTLVWVPNVRIVDLR